MIRREEWCPGLETSDYSCALDRSWAKLSEMDLYKVAENAYARMDNGALNVRTFGRDAVVDIGKRSVAIHGRELGQLASIVVLHYLMGAVPDVPSGRFISFRQIRGGIEHYYAFKDRVTEDIGEMFRSQPQLLLSSVKVLGAKKLDYGDASVKIEVFPKLPVEVIVWRIGDGVRGNANVLFDDTAPKFLSVQDLIGVGTFLVSQLLKAKTRTLEEVRNYNSF